MGKTENETCRSRVLAMLDEAQDWVPLATLRMSGGGDQADRRVRELRERGHTIENRQTPQGPEVRLIMKGKPYCPDCRAVLGDPHGRRCLLVGMTVTPGHTVT